MRYKKRELDTVELGDELLVCEKTGQQVHQLNRTAAAIWKLCDGQRASSDIAESLAQEFRGASPKEVEADVEDVLSKMTGLGILDSLPTGSAK